MIRHQFTDKALAELWLELNHRLEEAQISYSDSSECPCSSRHESKLAAVLQQAKELVETEQKFRQSVQALIRIKREAAGNKW